MIGNQKYRRILSWSQKYKRILSCSQKYKRILGFFVLSYLVWSQIWLKSSFDDHSYFSYYITKLEIFLFFCVGGKWVHASLENAASAFDWIWSAATAAHKKIIRSDADEEDVGLCLDQIIRLFPNNLALICPAKQPKHRPLQEKGLRLFTIGPATSSLTLLRVRQAGRQAGKQPSTPSQVRGIGIARVHRHLRGPSLCREAAKG